jgi:hypothetical protein
MSKSRVLGGSNKIFRSFTKFAMMTMVLCLIFSFQHTFQLMGAHHQVHVPQRVHDHPAMVSHNIGTEPLEVRAHTNIRCVDVFDQRFFPAYCLLTSLLLNQSTRTCLPKRSKAACQQQRATFAKRLFQNRRNGLGYCRHPGRQQRLC